MRLTESNLFVQPHGKDDYVICIAMPDNSRNFVHCQCMPLEVCVRIIDDLIGFDTNSDACEPCLEPFENCYYRVKMIIEPENMSFNEELRFHSRKLNLNDAVAERLMLLEDEARP